jgi:hypothetical protein
MVWVGQICVSDFRWTRDNEDELSKGLQCTSHFVAHMHWSFSIY